MLPKRLIDLRRRRERGIVLPVVLVMLLLMTVTVLLLMRRGTVDELLASNVRQVVAMDTAAQFALRTCERLMWLSPPGLAPAPGNPNPPPVVPSPAAGDPAAWRDAANWDPATNRSLALPAADLGVADVRCLFEDATGELEVNVSTTKTGPNQLNLDGTWRKFRVTAEVRSDGGTFGRAQAEVRMNLPPTL
jgi:hypothetical protein